MRLQLKFKDGASVAAREDVLTELASRGVDNFEPLFPEATDSYLNSIYAVDIGGGSDEMLIEFLNHQDAVEIAEPEVRRGFAA